MTKHPNSYGDDELARIMVEQVLQNAELTAEERDIFVLRFGYNWYYNEIGEVIGKKYRGRPYSEGAMRHRIPKIVEKLNSVIAFLS